MSDETQKIIAILERPFGADEVSHRPGSFGDSLAYIDWPRAARRLNEAVGTNNWDFVTSDLVIRGTEQQGMAICIGTMTVRFPDGTSATKAQFGGTAYGGSDGRRGMSIEDACKGAGSDALKKCAALFGVALDLAEKDNPSNGGGFSGPRPLPSSGGNGLTPSQGNGGYRDDGPISDEAFFCEECGEPLTETRFKDSSVWSPQQLAVFGRRKHSRILCMSHYREENAKKRRAEEALQQVPF